MLVKRGPGLLATRSTSGHKAIQFLNQFSAQFSLSVNCLSNFRICLTYWKLNFFLQTLKTCFISVFVCFGSLLSLATDYLAAVAEDIIYGNPRTPSRKYSERTSTDQDFRSCTAATTISPAEGAGSGAPTPVLTSAGEIAATNVTTAASIQILSWIKAIREFQNGDVGKQLQS